jgi:hypothetical protein
MEEVIKDKFVERRSGVIKWHINGGVSITKN